MKSNTKYTAKNAPTPPFTHFSLAGEDSLNECQINVVQIGRTPTTMVPTRNLIYNSSQERPTNTQPDNTNTHFTTKAANQIVSDDSIVVLGRFVFTTDRPRTHYDDGFDSYEFNILKYVRFDFTE